MFSCFVYDQYFVVCVGRLGLVTAAAKKQLEIAHTLLAYHAKTAAIEPLTNTSAMVMAFQKNHTEVSGCAVCTENICTRICANLTVFC